MFGAIIVISDHIIGQSSCWTLTSEKGAPPSKQWLLLRDLSVAVAGGHPTLTVIGLVQHSQFASVSKASDLHRRSKFDLALTGACPSRY